MGPTGEEVDRLLERTGFPRPLWFLTNLFRRPEPSKGAPHPAEDWEEGIHALKEELARVQPKLIVPLGREAIRFFLGDVDVDEVWGLHLRPPADVIARLPMLRAGVTIAPQVHPAAGFHSPEASNQVLVGFDALKKILQGRTPARLLEDDPWPDPTYRELLTVHEFYQWAWDTDPRIIPAVANDTEGYPHAPWSIQLSATPGTGVLLRKPAVITAYVAWARRVGAITTFHSGLHDARMNRIMGLDVFDPDCPIPIEDTQLMAYILGVIPQGLKPLATRECGMPMLGYKEVLGDAQERHARTYLQWLWDGENERYKAMCAEEFDFQTRVVGRRIKKVPKLPKLPLMKVAERVLGSKDPYRLWNDQVIDTHVAAHRLLGPMQEASLSDVEPGLALRYAARDPDATGRLRDVLLPRVREQGLEEVYRLDLGTYPIVSRMMEIGMQPDPAAFAKLAVLLDAEIATLKAKLALVTGWADFNPNSGDQTAEYVFGVLGLEVLGKRTDSGRGSTNDKVLEALEKMYPEYPQLAEIRSYREWFKLRHTFVARVPEFAERWPHDGRIHCELMLTRTPSGRLASKNPNMLAMPKHGKFAKAFRACFVPREGCMFVSADESQVELRTLAHLSQDPVMCAIFRGETRNPDGSLIDLHAATAQRIFGVAPKDQDESKHRLPAKCFHPDTEVLTERGWSRILDLSAGERVMQAEPREDGSVGLSWTVPTSVFSERREELIELHNEGMALRVTPDHRMVGWGSTGRLFVAHPEQFSTRARYWANAGLLESGGSGPSPALLRLAVATQADGSISAWQSIRFGFSKARKIERMRELLDAAGIDGHESSSRNGKWQCSTTFSIHKTDAAAILNLLDTDKTLPWEWLQLPTAARELVLQELAHWDSCIRENWRMTRYTSYTQKNLDVVQALAAITNKKTRLSGHNLSIRARHNSRGGELSCRPVRYEGQVACLSVPSSFVLVRDKGVPVIVGQSVNFGIPMGMTCVGLCLELRKGGMNVDEDDAQRWIDETEAMFAEVPVYKQRMIAEAERNGFVRCLSGRIRYVGGIRSKDDRVRSEAERFAFSTPIQEGAQWIAKHALAAAWRDVYVPERRLGHYVEPLLWTHDDLLSEVDTKYVLDVAPRLRQCLTAPPKGFSIPLETKPEAGLNWAEMVKL